MITKQKRTSMETLIYNVFDALDPSGVNTSKYKQLFKSMSDNQFDTFFKNLFKDETRFLTLDIVDYETVLTLEQCESAAKILKIPLFEHVIMCNNTSGGEDWYSTKHPVPVGYIHVKRTQQLLSKKNSGSTDISSRSAMTGQVTGDDKNSRTSDQENFALVNLGGEAILKELMGPRADDLSSKADMYSAISTKGYVSLEDISNNPENKVTLNTVDVMFLSMGIKTDLVTKNLLLKKTIND